MFARSARLLLTLVLVACSGLLAAIIPLGLAPVGAEPSLDLTPFRGPCTTKVTACGTGFAPGLDLIFTSQLEGSPNDRAIVFAQATVGADGSVEVIADLARLIPGCAEGTAPVGQQYRLSARDANTNSLLAYALFIVTAPEAVPTLTLDPASGPCAEPNPLILTRGAGFPAGIAVVLEVRDAAGGILATFPGGTVTADGTFTAGIRLIGCGPGTPAGASFTVVALGGDPPAELARATYNTTPGGTGDKLCFPETNQCIAGRFLAYWQAHGGLAINGYPLSEEFRQTLEDGKEYLVQYFERVRLEYHPENAPPQDIQLGQFGRRILATVAGAPTAPTSPRDGYVHFRETGHNVAPDLLAYWEANGGLAQFGFPLTEEFTQQLEDGKAYTVQYFERARFERHPQNAPPYNILLGQFGRRILAETRR
jgi:hypothetical protein